MSESIKLDKIHQEKSIFNSIILFLLALFYCLWGTGWSIPILNISFAAMWYLMILFLLITPYTHTNIFNNWIEAIILLLLLLLLLGYSLIALPQVIISDDPMRDMKYLLAYDFKFIVSIGSIFVFWKACSSFDDLEFLFKWISLTYFFVTIFLFWKYFYVYEVNWLGVSLFDFPTKMGKNSFAIAAAIIFPYLVAFLFSNRRNWNNFFGFLGVAAIIAVLITIQSRAMSLGVLVGLLSFGFFLKNKKIQIIIAILISIILIFVSVSSLNLTKYMLKEGIFDESKWRNYSRGIMPTIVSFPDIKPTINTFDYGDYSDTEGGLLQKYLSSHRGWLTKEGISGFKNSYFMGNGVSTFRIRPSNAGSRTESHNDYVLLMYEQGILGFLGLLLLLIYRIKRTINVNSTFFENTYVTASLSSLLVLSSTLIFINIYAVQIFWVAIAINWLIVEKLCVNNNIDIK